MDPTPSTPSSTSAPSSRDRLRRWINMVTLATPLGLTLARIDGARLRPGPRGTRVAVGYASSFPAPRASAVTIGDIILLRLDEDQLTARPHLLDHEARHSGQWALALGVVGFPLLYLLASLWSLLRCRNAAMHNVFEVRAGLVDGGYLPAPPDPGANHRPARTCRRRSRTPRGTPDRTISRRSPNR